MRKTEVLQEVKKMRFEEFYISWQAGKLDQKEASKLLGVCDRTFRRYINRYEEKGIEGLADKRLSQISHKRAPVDEVIALKDLYKRNYFDFNVKHFYKFYKTKHKGTRSYSWVKNKLQDGKLVNKSQKKGKHRKRRLRSPFPGMMLHQDGSTHEWVEGKKWDLIITLDDATSEHYSMFFVEEEGTLSSFKGVKETIDSKGLFCSLYTDRGSHYWTTNKAGDKVDNVRLTQFGRAMKQLGVEMIPSYSPQARGRCERMFSTHQERLVKELKLEKITDIKKANSYLKKKYMPSFNEEFNVASREEGSGFVKLIAGDLDNILCEQYTRIVNNDNCIDFKGLKLQIPSNKHRFHYVKAKVKVNKHIDGSISIFYGHMKLGAYNKEGNIKTDIKRRKAA